ncbi:helix-turn-helix domain-containing protein [Cereibacter sphaeroides]|uniref:helix-turn-helix domain-containing protein n=1 Tax=Cereibacter sphaeroides TaxID=1063 RepID=UPI001F4134B5|nr:helix-turn-helix domain-containing protein [Cereibacter sphaeroides]MCE6950821.1 helix-turn-helix domain-containing protein [Cereibacter sphaeroides]
MSDHVGGEIRALRRARGMTLQQMATALGRSVGWLSQIERDHGTPSVHDLGRIAALFDLNISFFFRASRQDPGEHGRIVRAAHRSRIGSPCSGLTEELLSPGLTGAFEMIRSVFAPHSKSEGLRRRRDKEDGGVLISGRLILRIGGLTAELSPGDSFQFTDEDYAWENPGDEPAEVIWIVSPPIY